MLNASDLGTALSDAAKKNPQAWFKELSGYLKKNTEFKIVWVAVNKDGQPDPKKDPIAKFTMLNIPYMPYITLVDMGMIVTQGAATGIVNISGFQTTPVPFGISIPLVLTPGFKEDYKEEHLHKAKQIIQWVKSWIIPMPFTGAHSSYTGTGMHISTK